MTLKEIHEKIAKNSRKNKSVPQMDKIWQNVRAH